MSLLIPGKGSSKIAKLVKENTWLGDSLGAVALVMDSDIHAASWQVDSVPAPSRRNKSCWRLSPNQYQWGDEKPYKTHLLRETVNAFSILMRL